LIVFVEGNREKGSHDIKMVGIFVAGKGSVGGFEG
jgi:hypothetical protein